MFVSRIPVYFLESLSDTHWVIGLKTVIFHIIITFSLFRISRFSNGFSFLNSRHFQISGIFVGILILNAYYIMYSGQSNQSIVLFVFNATSFPLLLYLWVRSNFAMSYLMQAKEANISRLEGEVCAKDKVIEQLNQNMTTLSTASHKMNERIAALETASWKDNEYQAIVDTLKHEYNSEILGEMLEVNTSFLNNKALDLMISHFKNESRARGYEFNIEINCCILGLIEYVGSVAVLETMIGDHLRNAIIACSQIPEKQHKIKLDINHRNGVYSIAFLDSGIAFESEILLKLGDAPVTSRANFGGSGIGFMSTFEAMKKLNASIYIKEFDPLLNYPFTKQIKLIFDGRCEYTVDAYNLNAVKIRKL
jgi:uncharacterized coiled-coil protein SlyX